MKQIIMDLNAAASKPMLRIYGIQALLDTGADIPVCCLPETLLRKFFHAELVMSDCSFYSFGNEIQGNVYRFEVFRVGELIYPNMHVFVLPTEAFAVGEQKKPLFYFILSASMFTGLIYEIDDVRHKLNITVPDNQSVIRNLIIKREGKNLTVLSASADI